jgi:uncharacterized membrane protein YjfL (UPF0719 family)
MGRIIPEIPWSFVLTVLASLALIAVALHLWGAAEVRASYGIVVLLSCVGGVWLIFATKLFAWLGISCRDDLIERNNRAALVALCGAVPAAAIIYAGGSLGEGPSYSNNFFSAGLGTVGFLALWVLLEIGGGVSTSIAEERDLASGIRLCGFLLAVSLVLGRAVAGDWHSVSGTVHDFIADGWPALVLCAIALTIEQFVRPSMKRPFPAWPVFGLVPALFYLGLAVAWLWHMGPWEGMP